MPLPTNNTLTTEQIIFKRVEQAFISV